MEFFLECFYLYNIFVFSVIILITQKKIFHNQQILVTLASDLQKLVWHNWKWNCHVRILNGDPINWLYIFPSLQLQTRFSCNISSFNNYFLKTPKRSLYVTLRSNFKYFNIFFTSLQHNFFVASLIFQL
jgi:hypothetical protein